jgi:hypothetical protein
MCKDARALWVAFGVIMERDVDKFRTLIILTIATWLFATYVSFNAAPPPADVASVYDWQGYGEVVPGIISLRWYWVEAALTLIGLVGMFFFRPASRTLVLVVTLANPIRTGLGGIWVSSPVEDLFWAVYWVFFMFTIGMAFFDASIKVRFSGSAMPRAERADSEQAVAADRPKTGSG